MTSASMCRRLMSSARTRPCTTPFLQSSGRVRSNCAASMTATTVSWTTSAEKAWVRCQDTVHICRLNSTETCWWKCSHNEARYGGRELAPCLGDRVLPDKVVERTPITKRLSATFLCGGIGASDVCKGHTVFQFRSDQKLVDEAGGETISGANIVHRLHARRHEADLLLPRPANGRGSAAFHDYNLCQSCKHIDSLRKVLGARRLLRLTIIGEKNIYVFENVQQIPIPFVLGIIVRIERSRQTCRLRLTE